MLGPEDKEEPRSSFGQAAEDLFPGLFAKKKKVTKAVARTVQPPPPPGDSWMEEQDNSKRTDVNGHFALIVIHKPEERDRVEGVLQKMGYQTVPLDSADEAIERLKMEHYQLIVCDTDERGESLREHLRYTVRPSLRRLIYFVLVGPELRTCYYQEAMALSANLVIGEKELPHLEIILLRGFKEYEQLFGPLLEELEEHDWPIPMSAARRSEPFYYPR